MQQSKIDNIETMLKTVNLHHIAVQIKDIFNQAINESISYEKFLEELLKCEIKGREEKRFERRLKHAEFPEYKTLDEFDLKEQTTLSKKQFNQLRELSWIEQVFLSSENSPIFQSKIPHSENLKIVFFHPFNSFFEPVRVSVHVNHIRLMSKSVCHSSYHNRVLEYFIPPFK